MAFLSTADAPKVEVAKRKLRYYSYAIATGTQYHRDVTTIEYEKRGMTYAAADSYTDSQSIANNNPQMIPIGGGGYNVRTAEITDTAGWET